MPSDHSRLRPVRPCLNIARAAVAAVSSAADVWHGMLRSQLRGEITDRQHGVVEAAVAPSLNVKALGGYFSEGDGA